MSITIINLSNPIKDLPQTIKNWDEIPITAQTELLKGDTFRFYGFQEMLIHKNRKIIVECEVFINPDNQEIEILNAYNDLGKIY